MAVKEFFEFFEKFTSDIALQAAMNVSIRLPFSPTLFEVGSGAGIVSLALDGNNVECRVEVTIASGVFTLMWN